MTQSRLSNSEFLTQLTSLFQSQSSSTSGSVFLTQKRLTHNDDASEEKEASGALSVLSNFTSVFPSISLNKSESSSHSTLFRATNGKSAPKRDQKIKIATVVEFKDLDGFLEKYVEVCRAGMSDGLKKRDRKKERKRRAKAKKDKKK